MSNERVEVDTSKKCECDHQMPIVVNYDYVWRDGHVICQNCKGFIRHFDAG